MSTKKFVLYPVNKLFVSYMCCKYFFKKILRHLMVRFDKETSFFYVAQFITFVLQITLLCFV